MNPDRPASPVEAARHLGELALFAVRRRSIERTDAQALAELERRTVEMPAGLAVEWLGVAGFRLTSREPRRSFGQDVVSEYWDMCL